MNERAVSRLSVLFQVRFRQRYAENPSTVIMYGRRSLVNAAISCPKDISGLPITPGQPSAAAK